MPKADLQLPIIKKPPRRKVKFKKHSKKLFKRAKKVRLQIIIKATTELNPQLRIKENGNIKNYHNSY